MHFARPIRNGGSNLHNEPKPFEGSPNVKISTVLTVLCDDEPKLCSMYFAELNRFMS